VAVQTQFDCPLRVKKLSARLHRIRRRTATLRILCGGFIRSTPYKKWCNRNVVGSPIQEASELVAFGSGWRETACEKSKCDNPVQDGGVGP
jgi:hypothetical protein